MKYDIKYACGHVATVNIYGSTAEREREIARLETYDCPDCYRAHNADEYSEYAKTENLPQLIGTEKQVEWAMKIRHSVYQTHKEYLKRSTINKQIKDFDEWFRSQDKATFWIDNRNKTLKEFAKMWVELQKQNSQNIHKVVID